MTDLYGKNITWPFAAAAAIPAKEPRDSPLGSRCPLSREENKQRNGIETSQGIYAIEKAVVIPAISACFCLVLFNAL